MHTDICIYMYVQKLEMGSIRTLYLPVVRMMGSTHYIYIYIYVYIGSRDGYYSPTLSLFLEDVETDLIAPIPTLCILEDGKTLNCIHTNTCECYICIYINMIGCRPW